MIRIGRLEIGKWENVKPEFLWFEYMKGCCGCRFLTICNVLFVYYNKECEDER